MIESYLTPILEEAEHVAEQHDRVAQTTEYLRAHTEPLAPEYEATINLWLARIEGTDQLPAEYDPVDEESNEPNDYADNPHSEK